MIKDNLIKLSLISIMLSSVLTANTYSVILYKDFRIKDSDTSIKSKITAYNNAISDKEHIAYEENIKNTKNVDSSFSTGGETTPPVVEDVVVGDKDNDDIYSINGTIYCSKATKGDIVKFDSKDYYIAASRDDAKTKIDNSTYAANRICTSHIIDMSSMFQSSTEFNQDISNWDVKKVTTMSNMFSSASSFNQDISNWDVSNVTNMASMFYKATSFNQDISNWNVKNVTIIVRMFQDATAFNNGEVALDWGDKTAGFIDVRWMFFGAISFNQDISSWKTINITRMMNIFTNASAFNQNISKWDVSNVTQMINMFANASAFNQDISNWNVKNVTNMASMFANASAFNQDISKWDVSKVTEHSDFSNGSLQPSYIPSFP